MAVMTDDLKGTRGDLTRGGALNGNPAAPAEFCARRIVCAAARALDAARAMRDDGTRAAAAETAARAGTLAAALTPLRVVHREKDAASATPAKFNACREARAALSAHHHTRKTGPGAARAADAPAARRRQLSARRMWAQVGLNDLLR